MWHPLENSLSFYSILSKYYIVIYAEINKSWHTYCIKVGNEKSYIVTQKYQGLTYESGVKMSDIKFEVSGVSKMSGPIVVKASQHFY